MEIVPFDVRDSALLIQWVDNEETHQLWGGDSIYHWPITVDQVTHHVLKPETRAFTLMSGRLKMGYVELIHLSQMEYEISRVIISEEIGRGMGYGKTMLRLLIEQAKLYYQAEVLSLRVFSHNDPAIRCYLSLGFKFSLSPTRICRFNGHDWTLQKMYRLI